MSTNENPAAGIPDINRAVTSLENAEDRQSLIALLKKAGIANLIVPEQQGI